jgi:HAE1 family hydrophobic/amphiphilic exporter-1
VYQLAGANTLQAADEVRAEMERLKAAFPEGITYRSPFDTTRFVDQAVNEVYRTLIEAGVLVLIVILLFCRTGAPCSCPPPPCP